MACATASFEATDIERRLAIDVAEGHVRHAALVHNQHLITRALELSSGDGGGGRNNGTWEGGENDDDGADEDLELEDLAAAGDRRKGRQRPEQQQGSNFLRSTWQHYMWLLASFPLLTKALTAGLIAFLGDTMAQRLEHKQEVAGSSSSSSGSSSGSGAGGSGDFVHDAKRSFAVMIDGVCITGPGLHFLYGLLESHIPTTAGGALPAAAHVLLDTFLFDPVFVCSFFFTTALFEGRSLRRDVAPRLAREYWPALRGSWGVSVLFWPVQWAAFRYLPLQLRVASINLCDVAWTAALSYASHRGSGGGGSAAFELQAAAEARAGGAGEGGSARPRSDGDCGWSPAEGQKQGQISFSAAS